MEHLILESVIPESKLVAVTKGLQQAFNTTNIESIIPLAGGLTTALVYKVIVRGKPYVLRIIMQIDPVSDPVRQYTCMGIAAEAGIAPRVYYSNVEDALSITEFIEATPLSSCFASPNDLLLELAQSLKVLHSTPLFPKNVNFLDYVDRVINDFQALRMLPESATAEHFKYYSRIQKAYPRYDVDLVSAHNDLHSGNVLCDGKKIWIIDWETGDQNDRYADLANVGNFFIADEAQEEVYLKAYFGDSLDEYKRARFFLMRQVYLMFYATGMLKFAADSKSSDWVHDANMNTVRLSQFRAQESAGEVSLETYEGLLLFGKVLLNEALHNMKTPRFNKSVEKIEHHHELC